MLSLHSYNYEKVVCQGLGLVLVFYFFKKGKIFMKNLLKNKLILVLSIFLLIVGIFTYCSSYSVDIGDGNTAIVPDDVSSKTYIFYWYARTTNRDGQTYLSRNIIASDVPLYVSNIKTGGGEYYGWLSHIYTFKFTSNKSESCFSGGGYSPFSSNPIEVDYNISKVSLSDVESFDYTYHTSLEDTCTAEFRCFSNYDICDTEGNVVFPAPPQTVEAVELMKETQVEEIPQQIVAILKIIIPIFLAIFGTLLLLYLIKSKNLLNL